MNPISNNDEEKVNLLNCQENEEGLSSYQEADNVDDPPLFGHCKWVDIDMIPSKLLFFLNDSIEVIFISYIVVFLTSVGLDVAQAGLITGSSLVAAFIAAPLWGYLADCTGKQKIIFVILCLGSAVTLFPMPYIAQLIKDKPETDEARTKMTFWFMMLFGCISAIFLNPIRGFTVSMVMSIVKGRQNTDYGMQTLYGGVGVTVCSFLTGMALQKDTLKSLPEYTPVFYFFLPLCLLLIPTGILVYSQIERTFYSTISSDELNLRTRLKRLWSLCNARNVVFLLSVAISGACNNALGSYLFQLMKDQMNASSISMGLARTMAGVGEIIMFPIAKRTMKLCGGAINSIIISILSFSARFFMLVLIKNEWLVLPTQLLHGFSFALFWVSAAEYTFDHAPDEVYNTVYSTVASAYFNFGGLLGTTIPGLIYHRWGGKTLFFILGCTSGIWTLAMMIFFTILKVCTK